MKETIANNMTKNIRWQNTIVSKEDRHRLNGHPSAVLWFTGLSASGKSTLANALEQKLYAQGLRTYLLDGDNIRHGLNKDLGFSEDDRAENIRRIAEVAKLMADAGLIVISAFISPYRRDRHLARELIGNKDFIEIYVSCSLEECTRRDPKGLYRKALNGEIRDFTGISAPYEVPEHPDIVVTTDQESIEDSVEKIMGELSTRGIF